MNTVTAAEIDNLLIAGDSEHTLSELPPGSVGLVFTSPPYFNTRDYAQYDTYNQYLSKVGRVVRQCSRALGEGRFLVMNTAPTLVARAHRGASSKRLAIPFDMHGVIVAAGFDFVDDIIWVKPSGAGWATTRGARFAADRQPLQYKTVPVTEYVLVYRKHSDRLLDWNIRHRPDGKDAGIRIGDGYEPTNVWRIPPFETPPTLPCSPRNWPTG